MNIWICTTCNLVYVFFPICNGALKIFTPRLLVTFVLSCSSIVTPTRKSKKGSIFIVATVCRLFS